MAYINRIALLLIPAACVSYTSFTWAVSPTGPTAPTAANPATVPAVSPTAPTAPTAAEPATAQAAPTTAPSVSATAAQAVAASEPPVNVPAQNPSSSNQFATPMAAERSATPGPVEAPPNPNAQEMPATLLGSDYKLGGFGGLGVMYTRFAGTDTAQICVEGALLLNHAFSLGGAGCGMGRTTRTTDFDATANPDYRTTFGYGGAMLRYHFLSHRFVNLAVGTLVGAGGVVSGRWNKDSESYDDSDKHRDAVFVVEPQIAGYANITRWMRVGVTVGYRFVSGVDFRGMRESDLAAPTAGGHIQFGWF